VHKISCEDGAVSRPGTIVQNSPVKSYVGVVGGVGCGVFGLVGGWVRGLPFGFYLFFFSFLGESLLDFALLYLARFPLFALFFMPATGP